MTQQKRALITGVTGQDGSYLAELLLSKGYSVHGLIRRSSSFNTGRLDHIFGQLNLHFGDVTDPASIFHALQLSRPHEFYNLAAQSHVRVSFDQPIYSAESVCLGTANCLEAVKVFAQINGQTIRFYQASSSEMFGNAPAPQHEVTPFDPRSPYACAKVFAHQMAKLYRDSYGLFIASGILFNHESPRRGETFAPRKMTRAAGRIKLGLQETVTMGNLDAQRDWGFAGDYVEAMWRMLQQDAPDDFVIATGETHSVREFGHKAFARLGLDFGDKVLFSERYLRPAEVNCLQGDAGKAERILGWKPTTSFDELIDMMVDHDLEVARKEALCAAQ